LAELQERVEKGEDTVLRSAWEGGGVFGLSAPRRGGGFKKREAARRSLTGEERGKFEPVGTVLVLNNGKEEKEKGGG